MTRYRSIAFRLEDVGAFSLEGISESSFVIRMENISCFLPHTVEYIDQHKEESDKEGHPGIIKIYMSVSVKCMHNQ